MVVGSQALLRHIQSSSQAAPFGYLARLPSARSVAAGEQVFRALRRLGFPERDSKTAVARVLETAETLCAASLLRAAITGLTVPCC